MKPRLIVFEGLTCSGKTTVAKLLLAHLKKQKIKAVFNDEPAGSFWGRIIRSLIGNPKNLLTERERQILFLADRREDVAENILPALKAGQTVIQDRYEMSTFAYGLAGGLKLAELNALRKRIIGGAGRKADLTFYFDVDPATAIRRLAQSGKVTDMYEVLAHSRKVRAAYKKLIGMKQFGKVVVIDGRKSVDEVFVDIIRRIA